MENKTRKIQPTKISIFDENGEIPPIWKDIFPLILSFLTLKKLIGYTFIEYNEINGEESKRTKIDGINLVSKFFKFCSERVTNGNISAYKTNHFWEIPEYLTENQAIQFLQQNESVLSLHLSKWLNQQALKIENLVTTKKAAQNKILKNILHSCCNTKETCRFKELYLDKTSVSFSNIKSFPNLSNLEVISLKETDEISNYNNFLLDLLNKTSKNRVSPLEKIDLNSTNLDFSREKLHDFPELLNLRYLDLESATINDEKFLKLIGKTTITKDNKKISNIEILNCLSTEITLSNVKYLPNFPELEVAYFNYDDEEIDEIGEIDNTIKKENLLNFLKKAPKLEHFKCYYENKNRHRTFLKFENEKERKIVKKQLKGNFKEPFNFSLSL